eukprot:6588878-Prymnesium_polylepis.1
MSRRLPSWATASIAGFVNTYWRSDPTRATAGRPTDPHAASAHTSGRPPSSIRSALRTPSTTQSRVARERLTSSWRRSRGVITSS